MNYPVWELYYMGGGLLIALIAVVHVYVAHFAVGGGFFLVLTEMKAYRENSAAVLEYVQQHTKFFLLLTMVFSSVTGVGIWFTISLLSPGATSLLIHIFVFGFAVEWVCFTIEIVAIFLYFYTFNKISRRSHIIIGWIYAAAALLSLVLINGIISFMLTPGDWIETKNFWDGFFNPSFVPSMFFRIAIALVLAGIFGFITAVFIKEKNFKEQMIQYCSKWLLLPFLFMVLFAFWYFSALPEPVKAMILGKSPELVFVTKIFVFILPVIFLSGLLMALKMPGKVKKPLAFVILFIGLIYMGSFEWIREAGRRPYLIPNYMYSTTIKQTETSLINEKGLLKTAKWTKEKEIGSDNIMNAGREIFKLQCRCCHSVGGLMNDIVPLTENFSVHAMDAQLNGQGKIYRYMPEFLGTEPERLALAKYIVHKLNDKKERSKEMASADKGVLIENKMVSAIPDFDEKNDKYVLLAWNSLGLHSMPDSSKTWFKPAENDFFAQLIKRGETPEIISEGVELTGMIQFDAKEAGTLITLEPDEENLAFIAQDMTVIPYSEVNSHQSYPLIKVEAKEKNSGIILAQTLIAAPVAQEMGCKNCHSNQADSTAAADDILAKHDKRHKTDLQEQIKQEKPFDCHSCHFDKLLNISAAVHGFHANYLTRRGARSCRLCHTSTDNIPLLKGIHHQIGLDCTSCHGTLEDLGLSLLKAEKETGKKGADMLMKHLVPVKVESVKDIKPREPWINQPDCLNCHIDFDMPDTDEIFNVYTQTEDQLYRQRMDYVGIMCQACHGSTHALYPAAETDSTDRYNMLPMQYQNSVYPIGSNKNCKICHTIDMDYEMHHPNSLTLFRNIR